MSISFINHKGTKILYCDYSKCKTSQDTLAQLKKVRDFFLASHDKFIVLNDFSNAPVSNEFMELAKKYAKEAFDDKTINSACVGITGIKKILLAAFNIVAKHKINSFDKKEDALDFLVKG
jgi:hypothetical protein